MSIFSRKTSDSESVAEAPLARPALSAPVGFETVFGTTCTLEGTLTSSGNVRIDGTFSGALSISGNILVGETAKITADIHARNISIAGAVRGNVSGNKVQILRTGRVWGDIHANALTMEEGAFLDGKITMQGHQAAGASSSSEAAPIPPPASQADSAPPQAESKVTDPQPSDSADDGDSGSGGGSGGSDGDGE
ncbi:MAG: polymer-forming cytoskeletal protein [Anaerolineae bacterium]|nr:polymer-forming cytoskeletal protein [Anaerolineae bacterium]MDW8173856.1 polymer-forming cytoskeletal protein [Anaerolineae bacterium]